MACAVEIVGTFWISGSLDRTASLTSVSGGWGGRRKAIRQHQGRSVCAPSDTVGGLAPTQTVLVDSLQNAAECQDFLHLEKIQYPIVIYEKLTVFS
jgi:hypothetical protein